MHFIWPRIKVSFPIHPYGKSNYSAVRPSKREAPGIEPSVTISSREPRRSLIRTSPSKHDRNIQSPSSPSHLFPLQGQDGRSEASVQDLSALQTECRNLSSQEYMAQALPGQDPSSPEPRISVCNPGLMFADVLGASSERFIERIFKECHSSKSPLNPLLDEADAEYLQRKGVFVLPERATW